MPISVNPNQIVMNSSGRLSAVSISPVGFTIYIAITFCFGLNQNEKGVRKHVMK